MVGSRSAGLFALAATVGSALGAAVPQAASTVYVTECIPEPTPVPVATQYATSTVYGTKIYTITSCAPTATNCPAKLGSVTTEIEAISTTVCPVEEASSATKYTTSTVYSTKVYTITSCAPTVTNCPAKLGSVTTEIVDLYTTVCPVSGSSTASSVPVVYGSSSTTVSPGPVATLVPALPFAHNSSDITWLDAYDSAYLYYAEQPGYHDPSVASQFAKVTTNFTFPSVILDHSDFIQNMTCAASTTNTTLTDLTITFSTQDAYDFASTSWASYANLVLISYFSGCGNNGNQRTFWSINTAFTFSQSSLSVTVGSIEIGLEDSITDMEIGFGNYNPPTNATNTTTGGLPTQTGGVSSNSTSNNSTCGAPPSSTINGFPAAACGSSFDQDLDNAIGYLDFDDADFTSSLGEFLPGLPSNDTNESDYETDDGQEYRRKRGLIERRWSLLGFVKKVAGPIYNAAKAGLSNLPVVGKAIAAGFKAVEAVVDHPFHPAVEKVINIDIGPKADVASPFGQAAQLYTYTGTSTSGKASGNLAVYCVDCGLKATVDIMGTVTVSLISGLTAGSIGLKGNVHAGLGLGLDAQVEYKNTITKPLVSAGLPGFSVPGIITLGPFVSLSAELELEAKAIGQLFAGIAMDIPNFDATLDVFDSTKSVSSGFTPVFTKNFTATGEIDISANFGLPLKLGIGLVIPVIKFDKSIGIVERPGLNASASFTGSTDAAILATMACPNGVAYSVSLTNDVSLDFFGKVVDLFPYSKTLAADCILLIGSPATPSTVTSTTTTATPTDAPTDTPTDAPATTPTDDPTTTDTPTVTDSPTTTDDPATTEAPITTEALTERAIEARTTTDLPASTTVVGTDPVETLDTAAPTGVTDFEDFSEPPPAENSADEGITYVSIVDTSSTYQLTADDDGNFYLDNVGYTSSLFASYGSVVAADDQNRVMHFYDDTMAKYGVSRFRISSQDTIPKTAQAASLALLDYDGSDSTPSVFVVADLSGHYYYTVACTISGEYSKVFLVNDIDKGPVTLMDPSLMYIITGGEVTDCSYVPFTTLADTASDQPAS